MYLETEDALSGGGQCIFLRRTEARKLICFDLKYAINSIQFSLSLHTSVLSKIDSVLSLHTKVLRNGDCGGSNEEGFFTESDIYWVPASSSAELYEQLSKYRFREIPRSQIQ